jgi:uncharacterized protein YjbJ (UPF0337 family)
MAGMQISGMKERMAGRFMQWEGKLTGDPIRRTEGRLVAAYGRLKQAVGNVRRRRDSRRGVSTTATDRGTRNS